MTDQPLGHDVDEQSLEDEVVEEPVETPPAPDDSYLRLAADFDNYRKRVAREHVELTRRANEQLLNELLPVLDDLERALEAAAQHEEAKLEEGVELVHRSLAALARAARADGDRHRRRLRSRTCTRRCSPSRARGRRRAPVLQVLQKGYRLGDKVLRPARVIVAE